MMEPPAWTGWLAKRIPTLHAVIAHGPPIQGNNVPGAPLDLLLVTRTPMDAAALRQWEGALTRRTRGARVRLAGVASYGVGWLGPTVLQQSLAAGRRLLWGDPAVERVIPNWPPEQLDVRLSLDEQAAAEKELAAGREPYAVFVAAGALLIARRSYRARPGDRLAALARTWPEAPRPEGTPARQFVTRARELLTEWLFTWEGAGPGPAAIERYLSLRAAARAAEA
jgi:hypothetical protein